MFLKIVLIFSNKASEKMTFKLKHIFLFSCNNVSEETNPKTSKHFSISVTEQVRKLLFQQYHFKLLLNSKNNNFQ
jgi:hypothetical protein